MSTFDEILLTIACLVYVFYWNKIVFRWVKRIVYPSDPIEKFFPFSMRKQVDKSCKFIKKSEEKNWTNYYDLSNAKDVFERDQVIKIAEKLGEVQLMIQQIQGSQ